VENFYRNVLRDERIQRLASRAIANSFKEGALVRKSRIGVIKILAVLALGGTVMGAADPAGPTTQAAGSQPTVGQMARDFTLNTLEDKPVQLSMLLKSGPVVLVMLRGWVGYQCPICNLQVGALAANAKKIVATGARVVLVYPGAEEGLAEHAKDFVNGKDLPDGFYFVQDPDLKFVKDYGLR